MRRVWRGATGPGNRLAPRPSAGWRLSSRKHTILFLLGQDGQVLTLGLLQAFKSQRSRHPPRQSNPTRSLAVSTFPSRPSIMLLSCLPANFPASLTADQNRACYPKRTDKSISRKVHCRSSSTPGLTPVVSGRAWWIFQSRPYSSSGHCFPTAQNRKGSRAPSTQSSHSCPLHYIPLLHHHLSSTNSFVVFHITKNIINKHS